MGIMVYSLLWVVQDFVHQPCHAALAPKVLLHAPAHAEVCCVRPILMLMVTQKSSILGMMMVMVAFLTLGTMDNDDNKSMMF